MLLALNKRAVIFIVFFVSFLNLFAQNSQLLIKVKNGVTGEALDRAQITVYGLSDLFFTDTLGELVISNPPIGFLDFLVEKSGFQLEVKNHIPIIPNKALEQEVLLQPLGNKIDWLQISTKSSFENNPNNPVSAYSFNREEININPGAQGDIFRAISMLPGVSSSGGVYSAISVRGQGVRDNVYMVDDIPLTEVGHLEGNSFFNDPNGGRFSIFAPRVVDRADFQAGGFGSQYGRRSASYLGLYLKEGNRKNFITDGQFDLLGINVNIDGPIKSLKNTTIFLSMRYQNFIGLVNVIGLKDIGLPRYADFILKTTTQLSNQWKLSSLVIVAPERYTRDINHVKADKNLNLVYMPDFKRNKMVVGVNLKKQIKPGFNFTQVIYHNLYTSDITVGKAYPRTDSLGKRINNDFSFNPNIQEQVYSESKTGYRTFIQRNFSKKTGMVLGIESEYIQLKNNRIQHVNDTQYIYYRGQNFPGQNYLILLPEYVNIESNKQAWNHSAYINFNTHLFQRLTLNFGLRYDYLGFNKQGLIAPRVNGKYEINTSNSLGFAWGKYNQDPVLSEIVDQKESNSLNFEESEQFILSYNFRWKSLRFSLEGWNKDFSELVYKPQQGYPLVLNGERGYGRGIDVYLSKKLSEKWGGQISYSRMLSQRIMSDDTEYPFAFSQPHQFNFLLNYKFSSQLFFSVKYRYATGKPSDEFITHSNVFNDV
ncbi:MAG: hypothetical protein RL263_1055, partial [Bacteroidota bacterium]